MQVSGHIHESIAPLDPHMTTYFFCIYMCSRNPNLDICHYPVILKCSIWFENLFYDWEGEGFYFCAIYLGFTYALLITKKIDNKQQSPPTIPHTGPFHRILFSKFFFFFFFFLHECQIMLYRFLHFQQELSAVFAWIFGVLAISYIWFKCQDKKKYICPEKKN